VRAGIDVDTVVHYLAALEAGHAVLLVDAGLDGELLAALIDRYRPGFVAGPGSAVERRATGDQPPPHPDLAVLLSTSGTTGSPKLVRLSAANIEANASSIAEYLEIGPGERAIASLPFHYSYGLSVLNSHLLAGGTVVLPAEGILRASFWRAFEEHGCTSFAGVPYSYELLRRTGWDRHALPTLRTMTQAGGRLAPERVQLFAEKLAGRGARLVVMYGATEATARMSYVPPERLLDKLGSIGIPIPRGRLTVEDGELVYEGPNVMLGYAESREDLGLGDVQHGRLATGDLGHCDDDGFFFVTGRLTRFTKVFGLRVNLDEVERAARGAGPVAAVGADEQAIVVFVEKQSPADPAALRRELAARFKLNSKTFDVRRLERLPTTAAGKIDYAALPNTE
jgi:acyl-CoA synthetase (AMP-forming)/AMP-acid ligase II